MEDLLKVGVITTTHGVRGEVKVYPTTDDAERFLELDYVMLDTGREYRRLDIDGGHRLRALAHFSKTLPSLNLMVSIISTISKNIRDVLSGSRGKKARNWVRMSTISRIFWG